MGGGVVVVAVVVVAAVILVVVWSWPPCAHTVSAFPYRSTNGWSRCDCVDRLCLEADKKVR